MTEDQKEMLRECFWKWHHDQWTGDECMSKLSSVFTTDELSSKHTRTYTVRLSYDVTVEAHDEYEANALAYHWFHRVIEGDVNDVELPENVMSVQTLPKRDIIFVGSPEEVTS